MKYFVSMKVDGRIDVEVEADNAKEALEKAKDEIIDVDLTNMEFIDAEPVSCTRGE